jgi:1-deoxy-D-xylulose-5-phosphate synthase
MAYEAMNNAREAGNRLSSSSTTMTCRSRRRSAGAPPISRGWSLGKYLGIPRRFAQRFARRRCPKPLHDAGPQGWRNMRAAWHRRDAVRGAGLLLCRPDRRHNVDALVEILENVRDADEGPMLVHVVTKKGKGYAPAEQRRQISRRRQVRRRLRRAGQGRPGPPSYTERVRQGADRRGRARREIVAITAAMPSGTGLDKFARPNFPSAASTSASPSSMR